MSKDKTTFDIMLETFRNEQLSGLSGDADYLVCVGFKNGKVLDIPYDSERYARTDYIALTNDNGDTAKLYLRENANRCFTIRKDSLAFVYLMGANEDGTTIHRSGGKTIQELGGQ